jgi:putative DNA primase/helicase
MSMSFRDVLIVHGLMPRDVVPDGRWYRCPTADKPKKRNGCFVLWPCGTRGFFKNYAVHDDWCEWRDEHASIAPSAETLRRIRENREREQRRRIAAIHAARLYWDGAQPAGLHAYIRRKGLSIQGLRGLRERDSKLLIPMRKGPLLSVQTISADGEKKFWTGAPTKSTSFEIARERASITCLCEGLATGLAVFQAVPQARVIVAFDSGNLLPAAEHLQLRGAVVVCADNDHGTLAARGFNPGLLAAQKVADAIGCGVAFPTGIEGTDWADALKEWGERAASRIQREILRGVRMVRVKASA